MFGESFPYTNYHDLNLDWVIKELKKQTDFLNNELSNYVAEKIKDIGVALVAEYEEQTRTILFHITIEEG